MTLFPGTTLTTMKFKLSRVCELKKVNEKVRFVIVLFVVFLLLLFFQVSDVSHHHRDSFICLYLDLLEGKF